VSARHLGFLYVLGVPLGAGLATVEGLAIAGVNYTGLLWAFFLVVGAILVLWEKASPDGNSIEFPVGPWLLWFGFLWLSLSWCENVGPRNIQDAVQISMPLVVGIAGSLFVRSEAQLQWLLGAFVPAVLLLSLCPLVARVGLLSALGLRPTDRALGLTAALCGCVFMANFPARVFGPLLGWAFCLLLTVVTGSRMATLVLLLVPALVPWYGSQLWRILVILIIVGLGLALFHTPIFQERFFHEGSGTLADVLEGDFLSFGRFEAWPDIWDEAWRRPYLGAGVGSAYDFVPTVWDGMNHVHNDYLRVGFEVGVVGLAVFLLVLLWQVCDLWARIHRSRGVVRTAFAAAWLGLLVFVIAAFTDNPLGYNLWYTNPLFAVLGAAYGADVRRGPVVPHG
jgi:O-antigen ligase